MKTSDFDYFLPPELIAQEPAEERTGSRMLVLDRKTGAITHSSIADLAFFLSKGDLLVFNNTKVFPARTLGFREDTGGKAELLLVEELEGERFEGNVYSSSWICIFGSGSRARPGRKLVLCEGHLSAEIIAVLDSGRVGARLTCREPVMDLLDQYGHIPLPPYITRPAGDRRNSMDRERYQTVYADRVGAVAAPTAGLHFSRELLYSLSMKCINQCQITLHVGPGTFLPVKADNIEEHVMHEERFYVDINAADCIRSARENGGRVVAVGTTTVRTLEAVAARHGHIVPDSGRTDIFIKPPFKFKAVDAMFTNFHLPKSTLLMMVSAFAGREQVLGAYKCAIDAGYRFFSYGDCMLIL